eukprot:TRINITY_DN2346_c0_g1_i1.p1 TRINITY_DN2346_c0_g1~~TRINITY_DN2346_c0_g1_i1.p1  ORF type:complete len:287 (-),score=48.53 TRINITY_DN2346_c0_g1_i1:522-1382(-)
MTLPEGSKVCVLGCGNLGVAIARGMVYAKILPATSIICTKRDETTLSPLKEQGYIVSTDNKFAVKEAKIVIVSVTPAQLNNLLDDIKEALTSSHIVISVVSGASIAAIKSRICNDEVSVIRAMPNTAIAYCESMTCLAEEGGAHRAIYKGEGLSPLEVAKFIFDGMGACVVVTEDQIVPATALCACGIAFFCRAIRAAAQGGIEIGFHAGDAIKMAAQTAKGAATLLLENKNHPEFEVDKVTTPMGCTIAGLNKMEHHGFSSAMIRGIVTSAEKAASLYSGKKDEK